jgi:hypothetical protein
LAGSCVSRQPEGSADVTQSAGITGEAFWVTVQVEIPTYLFQTTRRALLVEFLQLSPWFEALTYMLDRSQPGPKVPLSAAQKPSTLL